MTRRVAYLVAALAFLTSCGESGAAFVPFLRFDYSGVQSGSFDAAGAPDNSQAPKPWATALKDEQSGLVIGIAQIVKADGQVDLAVIAFPATGTGTLTVDTNCVPESGTCTGFGVLFGFTTATEQLSIVCELQTGTIVLTKNTSERVSGTFSGTGLCSDANAAEAGSLTVTDGSFELTFANPGTGVL